jgi:hypothetical protein
MTLAERSDLRRGVDYEPVATARGTRVVNARRRLLGRLAEQQREPIGLAADAPVSNLQAEVIARLVVQVAPGDELEAGRRDLVDDPNGIDPALVVLARRFHVAAGVIHNAV